MTATEMTGFNAFFSNQSISLYLLNYTENLEKSKEKNPLKTLCVNSQYLNCETETSDFSQFLADFSSF